MPAMALPLLPTLRRAWDWYRAPTLGALAGRPATLTELPPVVRRDPFLAPAEAAFLDVLEGVVGKRGRVLAKVSLDAVLQLPGTDLTSPGRAAWRARLSRRTVDYLVCDLRPTHPRVAVELDPPADPRPKRRAREAELDGLLRLAELPLVRVRTAPSYDARELQKQILPFLAELR